MRALESVSVDTCGARLGRAVAAWCARAGLSARAFGAIVLGDQDFVAALHRGRSPRLATVDRVLAWMGEAPAGPAFRAEVEAFLAVTGIKRSVLGVAATGNPSFVAQLRRGVSPWLSTVERVRGWMATQASAAERREIRERAGPAPAVLGGVPSFERFAPPRRPPGPEANDNRQEPAAGPRDGGAYVSTCEAAAWLGLSPRTLERYRSAGGGPAFHRFGGCVRYRREDLEAWAATCRVAFRAGTPFGQLPFNYRSDDRPQSGIGIAVWAGGEYQYPLARRWRLRMGGDISRREYQSDEFDRMSVAAHFGPRWLVGRATEASLLASVRLSWLSDVPDNRDLGLRFEGRHRLNRRIVTSLNASWHDRRYPGRDSLNGPVVDLAAGIGWAATPTIRLNGAGGWGSQTTESERLRHAYRWVRAGATALLPWGFTVGGSGTLRWTDYRGNWSPFVLDGGARSDRTYSIRLNVHNRGLAVRGFSPQVSAVFEKRSSNAQLHDYKRISGELRFVRLF